MKADPKASVADSVNAAKAAAPKVAPKPESVQKPVGKPAAPKAPKAPRNPPLPSPQRRYSVSIRVDGRAERRRSG